MIRRPPNSTLFPNTPLFRSQAAIKVSLAARVLPTAIESWLGLATLDIKTGDCPAALLVLLALVREHPATSRHTDRKSTRLNSSHANISYAVFCLKKKNTLKY